MNRIYDFSDGAGLEFSVTAHTYKEAEAALKKKYPTKWEWFSYVGTRG